MSFTSDILKVRAFVRPLVLGINIERNWAWALPGGTAAYAQYLKGIGITHVRLFYPFRPAYTMDGPGSDQAPTKTQFARILDNAAIYIAAGLKVFLFACDVLTSYEDFAVSGGEARIDTHLNNAATWIAERNFSTDMLVAGMWNELGGGSDYTVQQNRWFGIFRSKLPNHIISCGSNNWQHYSNLIDRAPFTGDGLTVWPVHCYEERSTASWQNITNNITTWSNKYGGIVATFDEAGPATPANSRNPGVFAVNMGNMLPGTAMLRPMLWSVSSGLDYRLNNPDSTIAADRAKFFPDAEAAIITQAASLKASLAISDPAPAPPPTFGTVPVPVAFEELEEPDLLGPYGLEGGETDPSLPITLKVMTGWAAETAATLLSLAMQMQDFLVRQDEINAAKATNADAALYATLTQQLDSVQAQVVATANQLSGTLAPKASPTFTGTVTVPTVNAATNNTQAASTAYVTTAVAAEATARSSVDTDLQTQITALKNRIDAAGIP